MTTTCRGGSSLSDRLNLQDTINTVFFEQNFLHFETLLEVFIATWFPYIDCARHWHQTDQILISQNSDHLVKIISCIRKRDEKMKKISTSEPDRPFIVHKRSLVSIVARLSSLSDFSQAVVPISNFRDYATTNITLVKSSKEFNTWY